ncbi:MAG: hypothetical protein V5804_15745 [Mucilaginibacter sp.]|uniref:hypothetical protein n=1 Tax=Mucilaginibacter sp. TaxID=1882438 RepID=UPI0034E41FF9
MLDKISLASDMAKKDINQLAKFITDVATGESENIKKEDKPLKGRSGGLVGGKARADKLTPERRVEIAKKAAEKRWGKE